MTLSIYSKRLLGPQPAPAVGAPVLTVPAGHRYVIKSAKLYCGVSVGSTTMSMYVNGTTAANRVAVFAFTAAGYLFVDPFRLTLDQGDTLSLVASASNAIQVTLDGFDFIG